MTLFTEGFTNDLIKSGGLQNFLIQLAKNV